MNTNANDSRKCPNCGKPLPAGALAGLCPVCLFDQGAETEPADTADRGRFQPPTLEVIAGLFPSLEILGLLGAGGMGAVYQARQPSLDRRVALKVLPAGGGVGSAERFNREARALARLSHPNIVAVHEFGQVEGLHFFIMEFVDGANLRQLEKASRLSPREALQIIPQICDALQYAHDEGVVHRDIKPENVLLDRKGRVKIADFGLAKIVDPDPDAMRLTVDGQVMGTPHYMAPEQVERPLSVDHRADIYALGVVFYEMLTGDLPLGKFAPPSRKVQIDVRLDDIVLRALENDPARRYQQASQVKSEVQTLSGEGATPDRPKDNKASSHEPGKQLPTWAGILAMWMLGFMFLVTGSGGLLMAKLGVAGVHATIYGSVIGALLLAFGVIRALKVLRDSRPGFGSERVGWRQQITRFVPLAATGILAIILSGPISKLAAWALQRSAGDENTVTQSAELQPDTGTLQATLPGGGIVELLAVGDAGTAPNQWWRPDGTLETNFTYELVGPVESSVSGRVSKDLLFRMVNLPQGSDLKGLSSGLIGGASSGGQVRSSGKLLPGVRQFRAAFPPEARKDDVDMTLALESWRTIATQQAHSQSGSQQRQPDDPNWQLLFHLPTRNEKDEAQISVVFGGEISQWAHRVVAVDTNGVEHVATSSQGTPFDSAMLWTSTFGGLPSAQTREFVFQVRPLYRVRFAGVQLKPRATLPAARFPQFDPPVELSFDELLDLDSGRQGSFPEGSPGSPDTGTAGDLVRGIGANLAWMQEQGFDLEARNGAVGLLGVRIIQLGAPSWDVMSPEDLIAGLGKFGTLPAEFGRSTGLPITLGFQTREGTVGLMQILAFDPAKPGVTMRAKVIAGHSSTAVTEPPWSFDATAVAAEPELRFLAWQDQWKTNGVASVYLANGSTVRDATDLNALRHTHPPGFNYSANAGNHINPPFLHLWFAHPAFDRQSRVAVAFTDERDQPLKLGADGNTSTIVQPADELSPDRGWIMTTFCPSDGGMPAQVNVQLEYAVGPLEKVRSVAPDFHGAMSLEGESMLGAIGSNSGDKAFVALTVNGTKLGNRQFGVVAVTKDGREVAQAGGMRSGPTGGGLGQETFEFDLPLSEVTSFKIGTRPVRTARWKGVVLPPLVH